MSEAKVLHRVRRYLRAIYRRSHDDPPIVKWARRVVVLVVGSTVLLAGFAMIVLPGPAVVVIPAGLAILAIEFVWARRWLRHFRDAARRLGRSVTGRRAEAGKPSPPDPLSQEERGD